MVEIGGLSEAADGLSGFKVYCHKLDSDQCWIWESSTRFFAAMTYLVSNVSESIARVDLKNMRAELVTTIDDWDEYYKNRKPQLPWELLGNEFWNRGIRTSIYFPDPPRSDLIIFHPQLVFTKFNTEDSKGDVESTSVWEIFGINFWQQRFLSGVSIVSTAPNSSDELGLLLTINNRYSLGYFDEDSEGVWFFL